LKFLEEVVQRECDIFVKYWNSYKIRGQYKVEIPTGVPEHIFSFPERYGGKNMGIMLSKDQLTEVAEVSGDGDGDAFDFMDLRVKLKSAQLLSSPEKVESGSFRFLKRNFVS